jgi:hypothetical protein
MESKFIELHTRDRNSLDGGPVSVNVAAIKCFHMNLDERIPSETGVIETVDECMYLVSESYDEIKQLIKDSGILIHRADPRLDETHPLTMADLQGMVGEPVWNSNVLHWYLVNSIQTDPDGSHEQIILRTRGGAELPFDEDDLIKTPLYRMRRE